MATLNLSDTTERLLILYLAESILGLILFLIFRYFGELYRRRFLFTWSVSWLAFAVYMLSSAVVILLIFERQSGVRLLMSILAQLTCFMQIIFILRGTYELIYEKYFNRKRFRLVLLITLAVAVITVFLYRNDPEEGTLRNLIRVGSRSLITGVGFLVAGLVVWKSNKFSKGFGQRFLGASFIIYSVYQLYYCAIALANLTGIKLGIPNFYGLADLLLIAVMGMSMVMWLLEDEREKLEKANKELDQFLYSTSHDLRAPIASILGLTYLGKVEFQEEKARMFMDMIEERIKKLDLVIGDILSLSRSKKLDVRFEELRLKDLLDDTVADIKFNKGASAITLDYVPDATHVFRSDVNQMKVILSNLMANAVKYHNLDQPNPVIRVKFLRKPEGVSITIEDNGQGIPEASLPKVFDMFYRASLNTEGTGLGLYIVREALNKVKGTIDVKSEFGKGSAFTIFLENA